MDPRPSRLRGKYKVKARAREITVHAAILACAVWTAVGADVLSPGPRGRYSGFQKGNDFVQFYVAGSLARDGDFGALSDADRFREAQAPYFREGDRSRFPPVYGPQVALFFSLFARLPYLAAYATWAALTLALTFWSVSVCRRRVPAVARWRWPTVAATAAYPPLGYLVLDGQLSALALAALALAVVALDTSRRRFKNRRWRSDRTARLQGLALRARRSRSASSPESGRSRRPRRSTAVLQLAITVPIVGIDVVIGYVHNMWSFARSPDLLTRNAYLMASFRTFWSALLPAPWATAAYVVTAGASIGRRGVGLAADGISGRTRSACSRSPWRWHRPHLFLYDLVILAPAFVASAGILIARRATGLRWCAWLAFFAPIAAPLAAVTHVQLVTLVLAAWLVALAVAAPEEIRMNVPADARRVPQNPRAVPVDDPRDGPRRRHLFVVGQRSAWAPLRPRGEDDVSLHAAIVNRLAAGEPYYDATATSCAGADIRRAACFNWRTPLLFSAVAAAPGVARVVLIALGLLLLAATVTQLASESPLVVHRRGRRAGRRHPDHPRSWRRGAPRGLDRRARRAVGVPLPAPPLDSGGRSSAFWRSSCASWPRPTASSRGCSPCARDDGARSASGPGPPLLTPYISRARPSGARARPARRSRAPGVVDPVGRAAASSSPHCDGTAG